MNTYYQAKPRPDDSERDPDEIILERAEQIFINSPQKFTKAEAVWYVLKNDPELAKRRAEKWYPEAYLGED